MLMVSLPYNFPRTGTCLQKPILPLQTDFPPLLRPLCHVNTPPCPMPTLHPTPDCTSPQVGYRDSPDIKTHGKCVPFQVSV